MLIHSCSERMKHYKVDDRKNFSSDAVIALFTLVVKEEPPTVIVSLWLVRTYVVLIIPGLEISSSTYLFVDAFLCQSHFAEVLFSMIEFIPVSSVESAASSTTDFLHLWQHCWHLLWGQPHPLYVAMLEHYADTTIYAQTEQTLYLAMNHNVPHTLLHLFD